MDWYYDGGTVIVTGTKGFDLEKKFRTAWCGFRRPQKHRTNNRKRQ